VHKSGALFFGTAKESDAGDSGVQSIGTGVVNVHRRLLRAHRPPDLQLDISSNDHLQYPGSR
jgi:hypothetical protein